MSELRRRLYISTTADDAGALARQYGLGVELAEFCTALDLDEGFAAADARARAAMEGVERRTFHAPYSELCPAAIDPRVREITRQRYDQAIRQALAYGIHKVVIHSGYIPLVYFPAWFVPESIGFWRDYMTRLPKDVTICLENVMEPAPDMLCEIAAGVDDPRFRLCLDVGHAGNMISKTPPMEWIGPMAPWLGHVHIHNNDGVMDLHRSLGDGVLDMAGLLNALEARCPQVTYTIENILTAAQSVDWLRERGYI